MALTKAALLALGPRQIAIEMGSHTLQGKRGGGGRESWGEFIESDLMNSIFEGT